MTSRTRRRHVLPIGVLLTIGAVLTAFPFLWMLTTSLEPESDAVAYPPHAVPSRITFDSYLTLFRDLDFGPYIVNTVIVVLIGFAGMLLVTMAGYAFAKFRFRGRDGLFMLVLTSMMIPVQVAMVPTYLVINGIGLTDTLVGVALPSLVSAFNIFVIRQFMTTIPDEVLEAARIDGANEFRIFFSMVLPMCRPILAVVAVLTFISGWNSFLWPLILANDQQNYTLAVGLSLLNKQLTVDPPLQMAGASLMVVPIVIVFVVFQKHVVQGFALSGLK
ncbi:carbohydrate ABC transporter permease [Streptomyces sp. NBC_00080]|uniref:carbohydrate ABC transporter permease n=1 Tax=Streptomyces sp. NBC_00080 TaxID=2975645 RepID=UPI003255F734